MHAHYKSSQNHNLDNTMSEYHKAKVFRCIGRSSFAVQLADDSVSSCDGNSAMTVTHMPGVVQVHCSDVDWGYMMHDDVALERRLTKLGTVSMFGAAQESEFVDHISVHEGVTIALGPYDPNIKAFVQCMLRVEGNGPDKGKKELGFNEICVFLRALPPPPQQAQSQQAAAKRRRRSGFKWQWAIKDHVSIKPKTSLIHETKPEYIHMCARKLLRTRATESTAHTYMQQELPH
jgi:hypothetical protein